MKAITRRLRLLRTGRDITQRDLAIKSGVQYYRYMDIENGYRQPTETELNAIARALKAEPSDIVAAVPAEKAS